MNEKKISMAIAVSSNSDNRNNYYSKKASPFPYG